ncbi:oxygen-insensitive NADPH nitroreductase [Radiobacillus sp. PE A8.2]|uniref:oxygen-insensitive NADPH nitroreductase n=1 Tax=Radiobacillus sp. PE A8.2 TaxID=3380349 RepID=UPI00388E3532
MNATLETILNHRSIRKFKKEQLTYDQITNIVEAACRASTSSYMMAYCIIGVTDEVKKQKLAEISHQDYVQNNGHLFVFCADLNRLTIKASKSDYDKMLENLQNTEHFLVASIDAALAAQNAALAAESMGLGICYIGSLRNNIQEVDSLLNLPYHVIPLFGMAVGVPDQQREIRPRLPHKAIYFENEYEHDNQIINNYLNEFNDLVNDYYQKRSSNQRNDTWTEQMVRKFNKPTRMDVSSFVQEKKFNRK